jgi:SM-20-related protein
MIELFTIPRFVDAVGILEQVREATPSAATIYGGGSSVDSNVRRTKKLGVPAATRDLVVRLLMEQKDVIAPHFGETVDECEEPQFLRYEEGDFFVAHQDGNTPMVHDFTRFRRISVVIFLSDPADYDGGALLFHGRYPDFDLRQTVAQEPGTLVAFRSETTHEVTPLTRGERLTIASWYRVRG